MTRIITAAEVLSWSPCAPYNEGLEATIRMMGRETLTAQEVLDRPVPVEDRIWACCREEVLPAATIREYLTDVVLRLEKSLLDIPRRKQHIDALFDGLRRSVTRNELKTRVTNARLTVKEMDGLTDINMRVPTKIAHAVIDIVDPDPEISAGGIAQRVTSNITSAQILLGVSEDVERQFQLDRLRFYLDRDT